MYKGVGFKGIGKGLKKRKTVCGSQINDNIRQINLKVLKPGKEPLEKKEVAEEPEKTEKSE